MHSAGTRWFQESRKVLASASQLVPSPGNRQGDQQLLRDRIPAVHDVQMDRAPGLVVFPVAPFEQDSRLVGEEPQPRAQGIAELDSLLGRQGVVDPVVGDRVVAEMAALAIGDETAVAPLLDDDVGIRLGVAAPLPLDEICEAAVHQVFRDRPWIGDGLNVAPSDRLIGSLLDDCVILGQRSVAPPGQFPHVLDE